MTIVAVTFTVLFWVVLAGAAIIIWDYHRLVRDLIRESNGSGRFSRGHRRDPA
jgi:hypothetical protein